MTRRLLFATGLVTLMGCEAEPRYVEVEEIDIEALLSQCGPTWDVQDVESYDGTLGVSTTFVDTHEQAVGYHVDAGCSGTLIAPDLFLSAGHCGYQVGDRVRFNYQDDPSGNPRPTTTYDVISVVEQYDTSTLDYAIVQLDGNAGNVFGTAVVHHSNYPLNATVAIIQHPARVPKVVDAGPVIDTSSLGSGNWFRHQVDTTGGSSGSGVLGDNGRLVGVHTNAGCSTGSSPGGNNAMKITEIWDASPTLRSIYPGWSYCSASDPCPDGFGDCDSDAECATGTVCVHDVGADYGWGSTVDVCEGSTPPACPWDPGDYDYCRDCGPCLEGEGDCEPGECASGLVCATDVGTSYGWNSDVDVCELPPATKIEVRVSGRDGSERLRLQIDGSTVQTWNDIGTSWSVKRYDHPGIVDWADVRVRFDNDNSNRDAYVDWVELDDVRRQAEDRAVNTAVWQSGSCGGGSFSENMHCNGYIQF